MADRKVGLTIQAATLADNCERTLVAAAHAQRVATRQQVRAAARSFVRRHRRDASYLRWVLHSVRASSALAVALLGLGAAPAAAKLAPFAAGVGLGHDVGFSSAPALADLDGDGAMDLIVGNGDGLFLRFENTVPLPGIAFTPRTGAANPLNGQDAGDNAAPVLGDLDGDGDFDLVAGEYYGTFRYYENTGGPTAPAFAARTGTANPLNGRDVGGRSMPALGDLDADGDLDLVSGESAGTLLYFENTGDATDPAFEPRTGAANPLNGVDVTDRSAPALVDLDGDGDLDFVAGSDDGVLLTFENTGNATDPAFAARTGIANPFASYDVGIDSGAAFGDLDGDGAPDLVAGDLAGTLTSFENRSGEFARRTGAANPLGSLALPDLEDPALGDLDGDGDLDIVGATPNGIFHYFENTGSATGPAFVQRTGTANPLNGFDVGDDASSAFGDLDDDGDLDFVSGSDYGDFFYFQNLGSPVNPTFAGPASTLFSDVTVGVQSQAALGDLDGDGDLDFVAGESSGDISFYPNTGTAAIPEFPGSGTNPFAGQSVSSSSSPALGDVDGDGDLDLVVSASSGALLYAENTGSATIPVFLTRVGAAHPLDGQGVTARPTFGDLDGDGDLDLVSITSAAFFDYFESFVRRPPQAIELVGPASPLDGADVGSLAAAALADIDRDGDADMVAGEDFGTFRYFENTSSAILPRFLARTGAANPLSGRDVGDQATPAFADLDGDGDFDLLAGQYAGGFDYFANTGDAITPLFAAAVANPFGLAGTVDDSAAPCFGDVDGDADLDLVAGDYYGFRYFRNTGSPSSPAFGEQILVGLTAGTYSTCALADFDGDGDLDLVGGGAGGRHRYFKNTGTAITPAFVRLTGSANPLDDVDVGSRSAPAAADLNGDGTPDLVTGSLAGTFTVHYFPEPARGLLLGAGIALLKALERLRWRRD